MSMSSTVQSATNACPHNTVATAPSPPICGGNECVIGCNGGAGSGGGSGKSSPMVDTVHQPTILLRGSIARSIYERMQREEQLKQFDKTRWYSVDLPMIDEQNPELSGQFVQMDYDCQTRQFINQCYEKSDQYFTHLFQSIARTILCLFMSSTSVNGLLGRGSMFVFSDQQFRTLIGDYDGRRQLTTDYDCHNTRQHSNSNNGFCTARPPPPIINSQTTIGGNNNNNNDQKTERILLDIGAGDGKVTEIMAKYFDKIYTTEISSVMRKILLKKGYHTLDIDEWHEYGLEFDVIACLNVLDRCDRPMTMLEQMKSSLRPKSGLIVLALVLPFSQYVEVNNDNQGAAQVGIPTEQLPIDGHTFEEQLTSFVDNALTPNGLQVVKWTKLPYLCEGDLELTYYWLYDVVLVLKTFEED
ncbi:LOW QUALITY PROTEIN: protein-L-histidine N-pros-methyltransferase-like [Oppia nitens]|uniref:LOW QUALITY PROTEIN: protein-L-histidine N-pros-methyltransferase-like n=1 Tax=Oppia nitens TaxID=1686743 RepID=UPI0023DA6C4E|nr:LOW QUALITY PROTEIN: protein-L-histidine N-pros-methyltransferase-like [Oppia nitens]